MLTGLLSQLCTTIGARWFGPGVSAGHVCVLQDYVSQQVDGDREEEVRKKEVEERLKMLIR